MHGQKYLNQSFFFGAVHIMLINLNSADFAYEWLKLEFDVGGLRELNECDYFLLSCQCKRELKSKH